MHSEQEEDKVERTSSTVVDVMYSEFEVLLSILDNAGKLSSRNVADENFRKSLLLAAASYFERRMTETVLTYVEDATNQNMLVVELVRNKAVSRQYHTWFQWKQNNANSFYALFGSGFRDFMKRKVVDEKLEDAVRAFLELGHERNRLVHQDYGSFVLEKTTKEIHDLYCIAMEFIECIPVALREFSSHQGT